MATEMTKAALAAQFQAEASGNGGNGAGAAPEPPAADQGDYGLPPGVETAADAVAPSFGRKPRVAPAQSPSGVQQKLNQALPPPQSVRISKRMEGGKHAFINAYSPSEIGTEPGSWQVFIQRHLKQHLTDKQNWFLIESINSNGKLVNHGEHCIVGEMPVVPPGPAMPLMTPSAAPQETVRDQIAAMREMEELSEARRKAWIEEQRQIKSETEQARAAFEAVATQQGAKSDPMMTFMMTQMLQRRQETPPVRDPRDEAEYLDRRIERHIAPLAASVSAGLNGFSERLERIAQAVSEKPQVIPPDPMKTVADLVIALKPAPVPPPPPPTDTFTIKDMLAMQSAQEQRMQSLLQLMKPEAPKETFGLKDFIDMQSRQEDRTQRLLERMEATTEKRLADLKELSRDKPQAKGTLEALREAKEIAGLLGGEQDSGGTLGQLLQAATDPSFWEGFGNFVATVKAGSAVEEEPEEESPPIEVQERAAQQPPQRPATPPASSQAARPAKPAGVKPSDMGNTDYPVEMEPVVKQLAEVSSTDATEPEQVQKQILGIVAALESCRRHSPVWNQRIVTALQRVAFGGPKQVLVWFGPFLRGLSSSGKIPLATRERLEKLVGEQAESIVRYLRSKMQKPPKAAAPAPAHQ